MPQRIVKPEVKRFKELLCVLFGHDWTEYGCKKRTDGLILEEYNKCRTCGLENHDRTGLLIDYKDKYEKPVANSVGRLGECII